MTRGERCRMVCVARCGEGNGHNWQPVIEETVVRSTTTPLRSLSFMERPMALALDHVR